MHVQLRIYTTSDISKCAVPENTCINTPPLKEMAFSWGGGGGGL